jgi:multiple sugar transport system permease protein
MVGIYNYLALFRDPKFYQVLFNTLTFALGTTVPTIVLGFLIAMLFNRKFKGAGVFRTIIFSPYITPMVAVSIVWSWIFDPRVGILNFVLGLFGVEPLRWTGGMDTAMLSVIIVTVWKQLGWCMIFYIEAIHRVPQSLTEAARIDGAGSFRRTIHIILPLISPTTFFLLIINTINSLQAYDQILILTGGGPAGATRTLLYYYYQEAFQSFNAGKACAVAVFILIITVLLSLAENALTKTGVHYD